jgi:hypothetical protein
MTQYITLWHEGAALVVNPLVVEEMGLGNRRIINRPEAWRAIALNCAAAIADIETKRITEPKT